jgi:hypothetical protein
MATSRRSSYLHHPAVAARDKEWHGRTHEDPNATANPSRQEGFLASRKFRSRLPSIPASAPLRPLPSPSSHAMPCHAMARTSWGRKGIPENATYRVSGSHSLQGTRCDLAQAPVLRWIGLR